MSAELIPGSKIGQYEVIDTLGAGGMSRVYLCEDLVLHRRVALKQLLTYELDQRSAIRLQHEGQALARLNHPNIVSIFASVVTNDGAPFLVMELLHGYSLADHLAQNRSLGLADVLLLAEQLCGALEHAHEVGIVHRDIKPSNIFLCNRKLNAIKLIDFGIAKSAENQVNATRTGEFVGSPTYISPEQALQKPVSSQTDQYALACVLYECLTGHPPFQDESPMGLIMKHVQDPAPVLKKVGFVPDSMSRAVARALKKDPAERFESMDAFLTAFKGQPEKSKSGISKLAPIAVAVAGVVLAIVGGAYFFATSAPRTAEPKPASSPQVVALNNALADPHQFRADSLATDRYIAQLLLRNPNVSGIDLNGKVVGEKSLDELKRAKSLLGLSMSSSGLWDESGDMVNKLTSLEALNVSKNQIGDSFVARITGLKKLRQLMLDDTLVGAACAKSLMQFPNLDYVNFRGCDVNDSIADDLAKLEKLEQLDLSRSDIGDETIQKISGMKHLELLAIEQTRITEKSFPDIAKLSTLKRLYIDETSGQIDDLTPLLKLSLRSFHAKAINLSPSAIRQIAKMKTVEELRLDNDPITDEDLMVLAKLPNLHKLMLRECQLVSLKGLERFRKATRGKVDLQLERHH